MKPLFALNRRRWAVVLTAAIALPGLGATHYVDLNSTNPIAPYTSWQTAATTIQQALGSAIGSDTVLVTNGVYQTGGFSGARIQVPNNTAVLSVNGPAFTSIVGYQVPGATNGPAAIRCAYLNSGAALSGFTLTNGATPSGGLGGGVNCAGPTCTVSNCVIAGNAAGTGGGAYWGKLVNCIISNNISDWGGGVYNSTLVNCALAGNSSSYRGGGAAYGSLTNCLLYANYADAYGGGCDSSTVINCTVVSNVAHYSGGGIEGGTALNSVLFYNDLLALSPGGTNYHNLSAITNCCATPLPGSGVRNIADPPLFAPITIGGFHLSAASPCVNAGDNSFLGPSIDLEGNARIVGGIVDLGAFEFQSPTHYVKTANSTPASPFGTWSSAATNIQDAIDAASSGDYVVVSNGVYGSGGRVVVGSMTNRVVVDEPINLVSVNGPTSTVISGNYPSASLR